MRHGPIGKCKLRATQQRVYSRNDSRKLIVYKRRRRHKVFMRRHRLVEHDGMVFEVQLDGSWILKGVME